MYSFFSNWINFGVDFPFKSWDQQNYHVIIRICYIPPLYNKVPLYFIQSCQIPYTSVYPSDFSASPNIHDNGVLGDKL